MRLLRELLAMEMSRPIGGYWETAWPAVGDARNVRLSSPLGEKRSPFAYSEEVHRKPLYLPPIHIVRLLGAAGANTMAEHGLSIGL